MEQEKCVFHQPAGSPFRLSMMNCHYIKFPLIYFLDAMTAFGFQEIELFGAMPHFFLDDVTDSLAERTAAACRERGLAISSFCPAQGAYPMNIAIDEEPIRRRTVAMLKKGLKIAARLGCETMLVSPGFGYQNQDKSVSWKHSRASLEELGAAAQEAGVVITIEPLTPATANLVNTSADAARMLREVNSPFVKSMLDIGVMNYMGETVEEYFDHLGDSIRHIHFTDGPGVHVALGDGSFPMAQYLQSIRSSGYRGILSFEINDRRYFLDPDSATRKNILWLKENGLSA